MTADKRDYVGSPKRRVALSVVVVMIAAALMALTLTTGVCWLIYRLFGGWFLLADVVIAVPVALWWQVRAMRANGFPLPWEKS